MLLRYLTQTSALPERLVILSVLTADVPEVEESQRLETMALGHGVYRLIAHTGFMETPDVPQFLSQARRQGLDIDLDNTTYYLGRISLVPAAKKPGPVAPVSVHLHAPQRGQRLDLSEHPAGPGPGNRGADGVLKLRSIEAGFGSGGHAIWSLPRPAKNLR